MGSSRVQAGEVSYELHSLGWKAFQQLCLTIVRETWGQTVQGFHDSQDGGRDGAFHGKWETRNHEIYEGSFTVQCKFTTKPGTTLTVATLQDEFTKAKRLASKGLSDNYFLFTNAQITGVVEEKIRHKFESIPGINRFAAYGYENISQFIRDSSRLRMLIPRVYGLGDLSQIMDERAYAQAKEILSSLGDDLAKFVITDSYRLAASALIEHGFVLLLGEPACGKSTIAAALALGAIDEWGCLAIKATDADDFLKHSNPNEPKQFFWIDDAFGATQMDWSATARWNAIFPHMHAAVRRGARIVFTSRNYIYHSARNHLKESAFPLMHESQVVIQVEKLKAEEREQILYNHIKLGNQTKQFKTDIKPFLSDVAAHQHFSPEIARRIGDSVFTRNLFISKTSVNHFVEKPMELLKEIIRTVDKGSRAALAVVFMRNGALPSPIALTEEEEKAVTLLGGSQAEVRTALSALNGSLLKQTYEEMQYTWRFKHPTIRDALASLVAEDRELMDIYLSGAPISTIFREISCGDVNIEGIKLIVPYDRYEPLIHRIKAFCYGNKGSQDQLLRFLSSRCDKEFLSLYCQKDPYFISELQIGSYLYFVPGIKMALRLFSLGLLPENEREAIVKKIRHLSVSTPDSGFLRKDIRPILNQNEFDEILEYVKKDLIPNLDDEIQNWRDDWDQSCPPDEHFSELKSTLFDYMNFFEEDDSIASVIDMAIDQINEAINEMESAEPKKRNSEDFFHNEDHSNGQAITRSIFDDVDQ